MYVKLNRTHGGGFHFSLELLHFLGKYPGHGSNLYGYLWVDADSISANITNNRARREKVSKWLIFSLSRPGRTESHSSIYPSQPVSGQCKQNQKLVCIRKTFQSWLKNKWLKIGNCDEAGFWFVILLFFLVLLMGRNKRHLQQNNYNQRI